jgi:F-type H+-transporting ATPase subunit b
LFPVPCSLVTDLMEILAKLGIDWRLLIAQIVNFAILLFVLHRFAYRPMLDLMEKRTRRIEKGLEDAEESRKKLAEAGEKEKEILDRARAEAKALLERAEELGKKNREKALQEAQAEAARLIAVAEKKMEAEKAKLIAEAKAEIAEVVMAATEKILGEKLDADKDKELVRKALQEVE